MIHLDQTQITKSENYLFIPFYLFDRLYYSYYLLDFIFIIFRVYLKDFFYKLIMIHILFLDNSFVI